MKVKDQFIDKPLVAILGVYSNRMHKYNGYYILRYNRVKTEQYSIIFCEDNTLILSDSTKSGIDSIRSINDFKNYKSSIDSISFEVSSIEKGIKLMVKFENGETVEIDSPFIKNILMKFTNSEIRYFALPKEE